MRPDIYDLCGANAERAGLVPVQRAYVIFRSAHRYDPRAVALQSSATGS